MLPQNWKRVIRALEVYHATGEPIGRSQKNYMRNSDVEFIQYGLMWDRETLYSNINKRVDDMIEAGLVEETRNLLSAGYSPSLNALNTVGIRK